VPPVKQPRAQRTPPEVRRTQLVRAAVPAFARTGYAGMQLQDVAEEVGVTRNLIHHYFPGGKRDLYVEAVRAACADVANLLDVDPGVPLAEKMPANIARYIDQILEPSPLYTLYASAVHSADDEVRAPALATRETIALGIARNHLGRRRPAKALRAALIGYISFTETTCEQWRAEGLSDRAALERLLGDVLVATVAAAGAPRPGSTARPAPS